MGSQIHKPYFVERSTGIIDPCQIFAVGSIGIIDPWFYFVVGSIWDHRSMPKFSRGIQWDPRSDLRIHAHVCSQCLFDSTVPKPEHSTQDVAERMPNTIF